jgi:hypothetical protein
MKMCGRVDVFVTSTVVEGEWSASRPGRFTPWGTTPPGTRWTGGWMSLKAGLDEVEKRKFLTLPGLNLRPLGLPAYSQALSRR